MSDQIPETAPVAPAEPVQAAPPASLPLAELEARVAALEARVFSPVQTS